MKYFFIRLVAAHLSPLPSPPPILRPNPLVWLCLGAVMVLGIIPGVVRSAPAERPAVARLLGTLEARNAAAGPRPNEPVPPARLVFNADGSLRHLSAPPGRHFRVSDAGPSPVPAVWVNAFLDEHEELLGMAAAKPQFTHERTRTETARSYVKLRQMADGLPVFGGQIIAQVSDAGGVEYLVNQTAREALVRPQSPLLEPAEAAAHAVATAAEAAPGVALRATEPTLTWFAPELLNVGGFPRLAYDLVVYAPDLTFLHRRLFVDAATGEVLFQYSLACDAIHRSVFNANNNDLWPPLPPLPPPLPSRVEGSPPSGNSDVNAAFDYIGDVYDFYVSKHGRRGIGGNDKPLFAVVRVCLSGQNCPWPNASWTGSLPEPPFTGIPGQNIEEGLMVFGQGWAADDIVAHEFTHGVTQFESGLIYANASGAINEAFSDIWGEFVDQINGAGNDAAAQRWRIGEDIPTGAIRSMSNPPSFLHPDRLGHSNVVAVTSNPNRANDNGGVHRNSGIINKLCFLLTDGSTFRGYTINSLGMDKVVALFYEVNANLLTATADYTDLSIALHQAAQNLGWNESERANVHRACLAVEITGNHVDVANGNPSPNGCRQPGVNRGGPWPTVAQGLNAIQNGDPLMLRGGNLTAPARIAKPTRLVNYNGPARLSR